MKDKIKHHWFKIVIGASMLMSSAALLISSVQPLKAGSSEVPDFLEKLNSPLPASGKIMMHQNNFVLDGKSQYQILVWDSETGRSKIYTYSSSDNNFNQAKYQLPLNPLY